MARGSSRRPSPVALSTASFRTHQRSNMSPRPLSATVSSSSCSSDDSATVAMSTSILRHGLEVHADGPVGRDRDDEASRRGRS